MQNKCFSSRTEYIWRNWGRGFSAARGPDEPHSNCGFWGNKTAFIKTPRCCGHCVTSFLLFLLVLPILYFLLLLPLLRLLPRSTAAAAAVTGRHCITSFRPGDLESTTFYKKQNLPSRKNTHTHTQQGLLISSRALSLSFIRTISNSHTIREKREEKKTKNKSSFE